MKQHVFEILRSLPVGTVITYGQIGQLLGNRHYARAVGNILHRNMEPDKYPCYKVVHADGSLAEHYAFGGIEGQKKRLQDEGIEVVDGRVDLKKYGYKENSGH